MLEYFAQIDQPQADVISALATVLSALLVAVLGPFFFHLFTAKGVKNFGDAVDRVTESANSVQAVSDQIQERMGVVQKRVEGFDVLLGSLQESIAKTQNTLLDQSGEAREEAQKTEDRVPLDNRARVKATWKELQALVERSASNPAIDGRVRARYARIDRRGYKDLIRILQDESRLGGARADWDRAYHLWAHAVNPAYSVTDDDVAEIDRLLRRLAREVELPFGSVEAGSK